MNREGEKRTKRRHDKITSRERERERPMKNIKLHYHYAKEHTLFTLILAIDAT